MAKQKRKPAKGKPITSHQLFPAVVALWFGALFGLGSLAVRPSLLEGLVLKSHLDLVVPAAAPPLGVTARILVALILAALGAVIGLVIARRIARPKPIVVERKRQGRELGREESAAGTHFADASTRPPVLAGEGSASGAYGGGALANRRRALAIEHEEEDFVPHDMAPLPGGNPQVFDISQLSFGAAESAPEPVQAAMAEPVVAMPEPATVALDWSNATPLAAASAPVAIPAAIEVQRQVFQAEPVAEPEVPAPCPATQAAHAAGRQVFGMSPPAPPSETERQIFGVAVSDDHVPQEFVQAAGFKTTVFDQEQAEPLFAAREVAPVAAHEPVDVANPTIPQPYEPDPVACPADIAPAADAALAAPSADADTPLPSPAALGMTDLASRLAEAMRRRRAARAAPADLHSEPDAATPAASADAVVPEAREAAVAVPVSATIAAPAAIPATPSPVAEDLVPAAPAIPVAYEPPAAQAEPAPIAESPPPVAPALPRAMQPLALDAFIEEDSQPDPSLLPPRHIAMPAAPVAAIQPAAPIAPAEPEPLELGSEEELVQEASYASLLEVTPARNPFVRIDEPDAGSAQAEPVVIFPGQAPVQPAPFGNPVEATSFRRFDAPQAAGQGQPVAANQSAPAIDSAEADRALRAALSNLQRMSGAA